MAPRVLALESSCDETAAAVVEGSTVRSSVVRSQIEVHGRFGGVVPELASRHHLGAVVPVVDEALDRAGVGWGELDALAVTEGPGLVGALLVGVQMARGLATARGLPLWGVHHMEGHLMSAFLGDETRPARPLCSHLALLVSGGHTELVDVAGLGRYEILGATRDDAAGEAYDKVAKLLGLGYPGGPIIDRLAAEGDPTAVALPRAMARPPHSRLLVLGPQDGGSSACGSRWNAGLSPDAGRSLCIIPGCGGRCAGAQGPPCAAPDRARSAAHRGGRGRQPGSS